MVKKPKIGVNPSQTKTPKLTTTFEREDDTIIFSFQWFDSINKWCKNDLPKEHDVWEIIEKLKGFEQKKWKHLAANQDRDHSVPFHKLIPAAQAAAIKKQIDDQDEIWSIRLTGMQRVWGVKHGRHFMVIWWDPHHQVCPSLKN